MKRLFLIALLLLFVLGGCKHTPTNTEKSGKGNTLSTTGKVIADSLIYDVIIRSMDPENEWENLRVKGIDRVAFIKQIFELIYSGKYNAYDFFSQEAIPIDSVRAIENNPNFNIELVSKIQFTEHWEMLESGELIKRVDAMTFGIEHYSAQGTFIGHKALFTIKHNPNSLSKATTAP